MSPRGPPQTIAKARRNHPGDSRVESSTLEFRESAALVEFSRTTLRASEGVGRGDSNSSGESFPQIDSNELAIPKRKPNPSPPYAEVIRLNTDRTRVGGPTLRRYLGRMSSSKPIPRQSPLQQPRRRRVRGASSRKIERRRRSRKRRSGQRPTSKTLLRSPEPSPRRSRGGREGSTNRPS
jgi:hypothetical protein